MKAVTIENRMLRLVISDNAVLKACFMPFLRRKGLFIPSSQSRKLGEKIFLIVKLRQQDLTVAGLASVCWISPKYSADGREPGFGLHFHEADGELGSVIETVLSADKGGLQQTLSYTL